MKYYPLKYTKSLMCMFKQNKAKQAPMPPRAHKNIPVW